MKETFEEENRAIRKPTNRTNVENSSLMINKKTQWLGSVSFSYCRRSPNPPWKPTFLSELLVNHSTIRRENKLIYQKHPIDKSQT